MQFEWDEAKRRENIAKHGIDFRDAVTIWDGPVIDPASVRNERGERRPLALGIEADDERIIAVVYTWRDSLRRIISARRARDYERTAYQDRFGRGR